MNIDINAVKTNFSNHESAYNTERNYPIKTERYHIERDLGSRLRNSQQRYNVRNARIFPVEPSIEKCQNCQGLASA